MAFPLYYPYDDYAPLVDHPHERLHQHQTFFNYLIHRPPIPSAIPNRPDIDLSDTGSLYLLDIEAPGITDPSQISCHWHGHRQLTISGTTIRPWTENANANANADVAGDADADKRPEVPVPADDSWHAQAADPDQPSGGAVEHVAPPQLLIGERRIGTFRRTFHFPVDVDMEGMKANLAAGLLTIDVPKRYRHVPRRSGKVEVEVK